MKKIAMALAIALPLLTMPFLVVLHLQPGFLMLLPMLLITARRAWKLRVPSLEAPLSRMLRGAYAPHPSHDRRSKAQRH
jgi:hypothetical protein